MKDAFYVVPDEKSEYPLMGLHWGGKLWVFLVLQQGFASSLRIFGRFGDSVEYIVVNEN